MDQVYSEALAVWKVSSHSGTPQIIECWLSSNFIISLSYLPRERTLKINGYFQPKYSQIENKDAQVYCKEELSTVTCY